MTRISKVVAQLLQTVCAVLLIAMLALVVMQVVTRRVLEISAPWISVLVQVALVWSVFLGMALGIERGFHARVELIHDALPALPRHILTAIFDIITAIAGGIMVVAGLDYTRLAWLDTANSLSMPRGVYFAAVPVAGALMIFFSVIRLTSIYRKRHR